MKVFPDESRIKEFTSKRNLVSLVNASGKRLRISLTATYAKAVYCLFDGIPSVNFYIRDTSNGNYLHTVSFPLIFNLIGD